MAELVVTRDILERLDRRLPAGKGGRQQGKSDPEWGHLAKISGHLPFGARFIHNGHEYVASQAQADGARLHLLADNDAGVERASPAQEV